MSNVTSVKNTKHEDVSEDIWEFHLFIAGESPRSISTLSNLTEFCENVLPARYKIIVIDLLKDPNLAKEMQIFAIPTLIKVSPLPLTRTIGDVSNFDLLKRKLDL